MAKSEKRIVFGLVLSCWLSYTFSMCMKMVYSASMAEIKAQYEISSHVIASLPLTLYYSLYAVIQLILVFIISKINIKRYMLITFVLSGLSFISIFFYSPFWYICAVLAVNGITLSAVWCGSVMMFGKFLSSKAMYDALLFMGIGFAAGGAMSYGISALAIHFNNWRISFCVFGIVFLLSSLYMLYSIWRAERAHIKPSEITDKIRKNVYKADKISARYILMMASIATFFLCLLSYGFTNWMPTILGENFGIARSKSTLISMFLPIIGYVGQLFATILSNKIKNDFLITSIGALIVTVISLILSCVYNIDAIITILIILFIYLFIKGLSSCFGSLTPLHIKDYYNSGSTSALINASACVSAAVSPFLMGLILDLSGGSWRTCFLALFAFAVITLSVCLIFYMISTINIERYRSNLEFSTKKIKPEKGYFIRKR